MADTITIPRKIVEEAYGVMRACGWHLAIANAESEDGVIELAAFETVQKFADLLGVEQDAE